MLIKDEKISLSTSLYNTPVLFTRKKDDELQICIDYKALNSQIIKNRYALPRIDELLDRLHDAKIFNKLDLTSDYWQIAIASKDRDFKNTLWILWIQYHALRLDKYAHNVSKPNKRSLSRYTRWMYNYLSRQHSHILENPRRIPRTFSQSIVKITILAIRISE